LNQRDFTPPRASLAALSRRAALVGAVAAALSAIGWFTNEAQFLRSYLVGWLLWTSIALGCLAILMLDHLAGGRWGIIARRTLEAAVGTLPALALLSIPVLFGVESIYPWAQPQVVAGDALLEHKAAFLNPTFFAARTALYFVIWIGFATLLRRLSLRQDETGEEHLAGRMRALAAPGLGLFCLAITFAAIDWIMSLDPHWFSSIFGIYFLGGLGVAGFAFLIVIATFLSRHEPLGGLFTRLHFHDYGKFLLAFVMLWTYFAISQLLIIWSANLPEEITWYIERAEGGWLWLSIALGLLHFALPFLVLLSADIKKHARRLMRVALFLLAMRWVDLYWLVAPTFHHHITIHWLDITTVIAVGGLWLMLFFRLLGQRSLLPINAPRVKELFQDE